MSFWDNLEKVETEEGANMIETFLYYLFALLIAVAFGFIIITILS